MSKVNISGVIMPESWWLDENVATLVDFKKDMDKCTDTIDLYIDSPGGDVMTSNTMSTMLAEWCLAHPNAHCTCTIGGLCASAAANILAKLPEAFSVKCYEDSLIMYHSAYAMVMGGPDALRDNAVLMDLVNSIVIDKLLSKTTLDEKRVRTAFQEGREMWIDGKEAVEVGLVSELRGSKSSKAVLQAVYNSEKSNTDAYKYAACVTRNIKSKLEAHIMAEETKPEVVETEEAKAEVTAEVTAEVEEEAKAEVVAEAEDEEKKEDEAKAECGEDKPDAKAEDDSEEPEEDGEEMKALKAENESLKAEIESLKAIVAKYNVSANAEPAKVSKTFAELMKEIPKGLSQSEYAKRYSALKAEHKAEYEAFMESHQNR